MFRKSVKLLELRFPLLPSLAKRLLSTEALWVFMIYTLKLVMPVILPQIPLLLVKLTLVTKLAFGTTVSSEVMSMPLLLVTMFLLVKMLSFTLLVLSLPVNLPLLISVTLLLLVTDLPFIVAPSKTMSLLVKVVLSLKVLELKRVLWLLPTLLSPLVDSSLLVLFGLVTLAPLLET